MTPHERRIEQAESLEDAKQEARLALKILENEK